MLHIRFIRLVIDHDPRHIPRLKFFQRLIRYFHMPSVMLIGKIHHLYDQIGISDFLQCRTKRFHQSMGQLINKAHRIRQFADSVLEGGRIGYSTSMQSLTLDGALEAVANNLGCAFTPEVLLSYIRGSRNIRYLSLDMPGTEYDFSLLYRKGAYLPPSTEDFLTMFRDAFRNQSGNEVYYG